MFDPLHLDSEGLIEPEQKAVEYLQKRMEEPSERGLLSRFVYNQIALGEISIQDFTNAMGGYSAAGIFEEDEYASPEEDEEENLLPEGEGDEE